MIKAISILKGRMKIYKSLGDKRAMEYYDSCKKAVEHLECFNDSDGGPKKIIGNKQYYPIESILQL